MEFLGLPIQLLAASLVSVYLEMANVRIARYCSVELVSRSGHQPRSTG